MFQRFDGDALIIDHLQALHPGVGLLPRFVGRCDASFRRAGRWHNQQKQIRANSVVET